MGEQIRIEKKHSKRRVEAEDVQDELEQTRNKDDRDRLNRLLGKATRTVEDIDEVMEEDL